LKVVLAAGINRVKIMHHWFVNKNFKDASKAAAEFLAEAIRKSVTERGVCHVILPGGKSPAQCLHYLSVMDLPWEKIHWYPGDERVLPEGDFERNDVMLRKNLWSKIPAGVFHTIPTEQGTEKSVDLFKSEIKDLDVIDVAFLGMGEDGHTASLFPQNEALNDERDIVPVYNSPKPPNERVSFGINKLVEARIRMVLTGGKSKADILSCIKQGENLPINSIGDVYWFVDQAAVL